MLTEWPPTGLQLASDERKTKDKKDRNIDVDTTAEFNSGNIRIEGGNSFGQQQQQQQEEEEGGDSYLVEVAEREFSLDISYGQTEELLLPYVHVCGTVVSGERR